MSGVTATLAYNQENRLTSYTKGTTSATYAYNGDGLRVSKTVSGTTTRFVWDLADGMPLILQAGTMKYVTGPGGLPIEQIDSANTVYYYLQDQLGSTRALTDSTGAVKSTFSYNPYGDLKSSTGTVTTPFGYAGQYTDSESGFVYLRARYYDPSTQQFLTVDPLQSVTGQPYAHVAGDPLNESDPMGLCAANAPASSARCPASIYGYFSPAQIRNAAIILIAAHYMALLSVERAHEMVAAAFKESSLNADTVGPLACVPLAGGLECHHAKGLFQLWSPKLVDRANAIARRLGRPRLGWRDPWANTFAILPAYSGYWAKHPTAAPGLAAARGAEKGEWSPADYNEALSCLPWGAINAQVAHTPFP